VLPIGTDSLEIIITKLDYLLKDFRHSKPNFIRINDLISNLNNRVNNLLYS